MSHFTIAARDYNTEDGRAQLPLQIPRVARSKSPGWDLKRALGINYFGRL